MFDNIQITHTFRLWCSLYPGVYFGIIRLSDDVFASEQPYDTLQSTLAIVGFTIYFVVVAFGIVQFSLVVIFWKSYNVPPKRKLVFISIVIAFNLRMFSEQLSKRKSVIDYKMQFTF
jgi:hypothetical protein